MRRSVCRLTAIAPGETITNRLQFWGVNMTSPAFSFSTQEIQSGRLLYGAYFSRLKVALNGARIMLWVAIFAGAFGGLLTGWSGIGPDIRSLGLKAGLVWGLAGVVVVQLMRFADSRLLNCQSGLIKSAQEAQSVTSGDPGLYKIYVDLHWQEWVRQAFCRTSMLLILAGFVLVACGAGINAIRGVSSLFRQGDVAGWLIWYFTTGLLLQSVKYGVQKLFSLHEAIQERLDPRLEVEKVKGLQEHRWREVVARCVENQACRQGEGRYYENISTIGGDNSGSKKMIQGEKVVRSVR